MKGDFSRGHAPDRARRLPEAVDPSDNSRRQYHRVLMQQGRLLLDSDFNATVDALVSTTRQGVRALGCDAGSPDLGFLVTPGRLLGLWKSDLGAQVITGRPRVYLDHRYKYLKRYSGFYIGTTLAAGEPGPAVPATVRLPLRQAFDSAISNRIALWVRVDSTGPLTFTVNGVSKSVTGPTGDYQRADLLFAAGADPKSVEIGLPAGAELWVGLIEQDQDAEHPPFFWAAGGTYHVDGLIVGNRDDGAFPTVSFPTWAGFFSQDSPAAESPETGEPVDGIEFVGSLAAGNLLVAYLEVWEQHLSFLADPGILEQALGGAIDTTTRSRLIGQVKIAPASVVGDLTSVVAQIRGLFGVSPDSGGRLIIEDPDDAPEETDVCDLPETLGYSGSDNRLYRFEVHQGGPIGAVLFKWSRDNGSELFQATVSNLPAHGSPANSPQLTLNADTDLSEGDLVEVLSDVTELGDDSMASITGAAFTPAGRSVGQLAALKAVPTTGSTDEVIFELVDPDDTQQEIELDGRYGTLEVGSKLRLRRWHGTLSPLEEDAAAGGPYLIEDGVSFTLSTTGTFLPGQYWQYQARVNAENANGPWRSAPHGPERLFAPLGLFQYDGTNKPLKLLSWLDSRFPTLCSITAEDVSFDGDRVGSDSTTVQEALEELFDQGPEIIEAGCGEIVITPTTNIQAAVDLIPPGGDARLCFQPGVWNLTGTVTVVGKGNLMLGGAGLGSQINAPGIERAFHFQGCTSVAMNNLNITAGTTYRGDNLNGVLSFEGVERVDLDRLWVKCGSGYNRRASGILVRAGDTVLPSERAVASPRVRISDCHVDVGHMQTGILLNDISYATVERCHLKGEEGVLTFGTYANLAALQADIGNVFVDRIVMGDDMAMTDPYRGRSRTYIDDVSGWGLSSIFTFDTDPNLFTPGAGVSAFWRAVMTANPIEGMGTATEDWRKHSLRKLGRRIARLLLGAPSPGYSVTLTVFQRAAFQAVLDRLVTENSPLTGGQGIVVGTRRTPTLGGTGGGDARLVGKPREPEVHVYNNRIEGFVQGIHLGASYNPDRRGARYRLYKAHVSGNTVLLRVPGFARERHGIYVGNCHSVQVRDNLVELTFPEPDDWSAMKPVDGIRLWGTYGPMVRVTGNHNTGVYTGVRFHPINEDDRLLGGVAWVVDNNAYYGLGSAEIAP